MNLNCEYRELVEIQGKDRKVPITIMVSPAVLKMIDECAESIKFSRGDFMAACFVRIFNNYKGKKTKKDKEYEGYLRWKNMVDGNDSDATK